MSWAVSGYVAAAVVAAGSAAYTNSEQKKAVKRAEEDEEEDAVRAAMHDKWAASEGAGLGKLGEVRLAVDNNVDTQQKLDLRAGKTTVRI